MSEGGYEIVFRGRLAPGADETEVKANLARLFKTDPARVEALFDGGRKVLKQGLDREAADRYRAALRKAGILVSVVSARTRSAATESQQPPAAAPAPAPSGPRAVFQVDDPVSTAQDAEREPAAAASASDAAPAAGSVADDAGEMLAPPGALLIEPVPVPAPDIDTAGLDLAEVGAVFDASERPPPFEVDLGALSASDDFDRLDDRALPLPPPIQVADLSLAEPEAIVDESERPPPLELDLGDLSASADYEALDERPATVAPAIDTSGLTLEE